MSSDSDRTMSEAECAASGIAPARVRPPVVPTSPSPAPAPAAKKRDDEECEDNDSKLAGLPAPVFGRIETSGDKDRRKRELARERLDAAKARGWHPYSHFGDREASDRMTARQRHNLSSRVSRMRKELVEDIFYNISMSNMVDEFDSRYDTINEEAFRRVWNELKNWHESRRGPFPTRSELRDIIFAECTPKELGIPSAAGEGEGRRDSPSYDSSETDPDYVAKKKAPAALAPAALAPAPQVQAQAQAYPRMSTGFGGKYFSSKKASTSTTAAPSSSSSSAAPQPKPVLLETWGFRARADEIAAKAAKIDDDDEPWVPHVLRRQASQTTQAPQVVPQAKPVIAIDSDSDDDEIWTPKRKSKKPNDAPHAWRACDSSCASQIPHARASAVAEAEAEADNSAHHSIGLCQLCWEHRVTYLTMPCAHAVFCSDCRDRWMARSPEISRNKPKCPICGGPVDSLMRFYLS